MRKLFLISLIIILVSGCSQLFWPGLGEDNFLEFSMTEVLSLIDADNVEHDPNHILLRTNNLNSTLNYLQSNNLKPAATWTEIGWVKVEVPANYDLDSFLDSLLGQNEVLAAEKNISYDLTGDFVSSEEDYRDRLWGLSNIFALEAAEIIESSQDVVIAIIDTGVDLSHQEWLEHQIVTPLNATADFWPANVDLNGHGTHVAATAVSNYQRGLIQGVASDSPLLVVRVLNYFTNQILTSYLINGLTYITDYAINNPEKRVVVNMSLGTRGYSAALKDAIAYGLQQGVVFVASAGNQNKQVISFPASFNGVISVAASDGNNQKASFSTEGFWNSVAAPGVRIWSAQPGNSYTYLQGTSMAAPHVVGASALLLAKYPNLSPLEVKNQLEQTAQNNDYSPGLGYGVIDVKQMLGSLKAVNYGGLVIESNLDYAIITLLNQEQQIVSFAATTEDGDYFFSSLKPQQYQVYLSKNSQVKSKEISVLPGEIVTLSFK